MINEETIEFLSCCYNTEEKHLIENAIKLSCGHYMCNACKPNNIEDVKIICKICKTVNERKINHEYGKIIESSIQENIEDLMNWVNNKFKRSIKDLKDTFFDINDSLSAKIQYIKEEIDIKIESLKIELDGLREELFIELDSVRDRHIEGNEHEIVKYFDIKPFEEDLMKLYNELKYEQNFSIKTLFTIQNKIRDANKLKSKLIKSQPDIKFHVSSRELDKSVIGRMSVKRKINVNNEEILNRIRNKSYKIIETNHDGHEICVLPNGYLLQSSNEFINVYGDGFELIKTIENINKLTLSPVGLDHNEYNELYIADNEQHRVIKTDFDFNFLCVSDNDDCNELKNPCGLCYYNQSVYVCNWTKKRIHVLDSNNLKFKECHNFNYSVWFIKIINNVACVRDNSTKTLYFYNLPDFTIKEKYEGHSGIIGSINDYFYEYSSITKCFYCYNSEGVLIEEIDFESVGDLLPSINYCGGIVCYDSKLVMCSSKSNRLICF